MSNSEKLGVVTCCWAEDEHLAKATCASVRFFCPDIPLCVVVDGNCNVDHWIRTYDAQALYVRNLKSQNLKDAILNSMFAKHAALFEGPFERFIYLDSDALFWGNLFNQVVLDAQDFTIFGQNEKVDALDIEKWFFSLEFMRKFDPAFHLTEFPYFCAGVYGARRGCLPQDRFVEMATIARQNNNLFKFGDQGAFNYLVFSEAQRGHLTYQTVNSFYFPSHFPKREMDARFLKSSLRPPLPDPGETLVLHFSGRKPVPFLGGKNHKATFTFFRLKHYHYMGLPFWRACLKIISEDLKFLAVKSWRKGWRLLNGEFLRRGV